MFFRKLLNSLLGDSVTESNVRYEKLNIIIILASLICFSILLYFLPEEIPVLHQGEKMIFIPSKIGAFLPTIVLTLIHITFKLQKRTSKFNTIVMIIFFIASFVYYMSFV